MGVLVNMFMGSEVSDFCFVLFVSVLVYVPECVGVVVASVVVVVMCHCLFFSMALMYSLFVLYMLLKYSLSL